jgi:tetratricopeptide (TPR) repeat protein
MSWKVCIRVAGLCVLPYLVKRVPEKAQAEDKSKYFYLRGRALNATAEHCPESEKFLSKAIKLNSNLLEAWNELGFCMWKRGDPLGAKKCFLKNVKHFL